MEVLPKLLRFTLFGIAATSLFSVQPAQAYKVTLREVGASVVATGSGPINLTGLTFEAPGAGPIAINAQEAYILTGPGETGRGDLYSGFTGPTSFGSGFGFGPNTSSGDVLGITAFQGLLTVPTGYVSGAALSDDMTFNNSTFASLGVTPGTYVWSWGQGANQRFTLIIGGAGVPDGGSTVSLLGCALVGLAALRRKLPLLRGRKS